MSDRQKTMAVKEKVLLTTLRLWVEKGVHGLSIGDIQRASGVSVGSLYHHFQDKEDILNCLYLEGLQRYQKGLLRAIYKHPGAKEGVEGVVLWHLDWVRKNADWKRFLLEDPQGQAAAFQSAREKLNEKFYGGLGDWLRPHVASGHIRNLPWDVLTALVLGPAQSYSRSWLSGGQVSPLKEAKRIFPAAAWLAVQGPKGGKA